VRGYPAPPPRVGPRANPASLWGTPDPQPEVRQPAAQQAPPRWPPNTEGVLHRRDTRPRFAETGPVFDYDER
jgi:hypothetical protein